MATTEEISNGVVLGCFKIVLIIICIIVGLFILAAL